MTRIIAGEAGGRRLRTPDGETTRPTSERVREALFSALEAWAGSFQGLRVLDLYAGSGGVAFEAWSRGASAVAVETDRKAAAVIAENVKALKSSVELLTRPVATVVGRTNAGERYDVVYLDPPYPLTDQELADNLAALVAGEWLAADARVIVERAKRSPEPTWPEGLSGLRKKKYGETVLWWATPDNAAGSD